MDSVDIDWLEAADFASAEKYGLGGTGQAYAALGRVVIEIGAGKLLPTLPTLLYIAMVFGVGPDFFFTDERKRRLAEAITHAQAGERHSGRRRRDLF